MANPKKVIAEVKEIISYGSQVYKILMKLEKKAPRFKSGQFLHLTLDDFDPTTGFWPESRVFSIASCSDDRMEIGIVYSVKGKYTQRMEDELKVGSSVWLKAPYGEFIISNHINAGEEAVLIAGGTGVSPFIPFLKEIPEGISVNLNYGLRDADLMIFEKELDSASGMDNVDIKFYLEKPADGVPISGGYEMKNGMLSITNILETVKDVEKAKFFISGPPMMIDLFKKQLIEADRTEEQIIIDEWS